MNEIEHAISFLEYYESIPEVRTALTALRLQVPTEIKIEKRTAVVGSFGNMGTEVTETIVSCPTCGLVFARSMGTENFEVAIPHRCGCGQILKERDGEAYTTDASLFNDKTTTKTEKTLKTQTDALREIAKHYGLDTQARQTVEELAELAVALSKYERYGGKKEWGSVVEEMVDVDIMLCQLQDLLGVSDKELQYRKRYKINRQMARIRQEAGNERV